MGGVFVGKNTTTPQKKQPRTTFVRKAQLGRRRFNQSGVLKKKIFKELLKVKN
jgi:hypothetical protein